MMLSLFIRQEKYKLLATIIVTGFFLFFWIKGPLQVEVNKTLLEHEATEFSNPKMLGELEKTEGFRTVSEVGTKGYGHGIILNKKEEKKNFDIITSKIGNDAHTKEFSEKLLTHAKQLTKETTSFSLNTASSLYLVEIGDESNQIYLESSGLVEHVRGYGGPINIGIFLSEDGIIESVHHISSKETESYLQKIANNGYFQRFEGLKLSGLHQIDAVSGATLTTEAIAKIVTDLIAIGIPESLNNFTEVSEIDTFQVEAKLTWMWIVRISVIFLMFLYGFQKTFRKSKKGIIILSILSVVYLGFFLNNSFTYISFIHSFLGTSVSSLVGLYALFTLLGAIWGKNTYCKYVCPFGNVQRLIIQVNPLKTSRKFFLSYKWIKRVRGALTVILLTGILLGMREWANYELFPDLFGLSFLTVWFTVAVITVLTTMVYPMIWCRLLCPTGSVLDGVSDLINK